MGKKAQARIKARAVPQDQKGLTAKLSNVGISPQKVRLVADQIRGKSVLQADEVLKFSNKKAAAIIRKLLQSAVYNAEYVQGLDADELKIATIMVDEARVQKRLMPRARGRADRIIKRYSHIKISVAPE